MADQSVFQRDVKDYWYVKYNQNGYPHVQQDTVLPFEKKKAFEPFIGMTKDWYKRDTF